MPLYKEAHFKLRQKSLYVIDNLQKKVMDPLSKINLWKFDLLKTHFLRLIIFIANIVRTWWDLINRGGGTQYF